MATTATINDTKTSVTLRVVGLGHKLTLQIDDSSATTLGQLKDDIALQTNVPSPYQRLICHGKNLTSDDETLHDVQIENRTKIMLMHNQTYGADKEACERIQSLQSELDELAKRSEPQRVVHELTTQICCKLDAVDIHGSDTLRAMRKKTLQQAEELDRASGSK